MKTNVRKPHQVEPRGKEARTRTKPSASLHQAELDTFSYTGHGALATHGHLPKQQFTASPKAPRETAMPPFHLPPSYPLATIDLS